ncbi:hypothetical protein CONLIGDRAFT_704998 [Coniochaeta ligniaria NRRL 30616]|uniref:Uncharacterized protein n=1 Tax=Coniochaeta ligniaria NRRL 30616 TaxID=1408157 RepID=A0A1J7J1U5_9PEZI|nr:hypothetical protein CONLIGDRAFT_704998 [Coniochaeta ligniaria NRRL 30616]
MSPDPPPKLPVAPNMSQILNRISLGLAKHERILKTLKRPAAPTSTSSFTPQSKSSTTTSGFSSLATPSTGGATNNPLVNGVIGRSREEEDKLFEQDRALPPNAGVGFVAERKVGDRGVGGSGKEDKMLRGRLQLGKRGEGKDNKDKGDGRKRVVDESEEEEGRSGLGRKKKRKVVAEESNGVVGADATVQDVVVGAKEVIPAVEDTVAEKEPQQDGAEERGEKSGGEEQGNGDVQNTGETDVPDAAELALAKKRKRKQAKKKRSKANKARDEATPDTQAMQAAPHADE